MTGGLRAKVAVVAVALGAALLAACGGNGAPAPATPTATPTPTPTAAPAPPTASPTPTPSLSLEQEVAEAYLAYWDAYAEAVLYLDISLVEDFAAGDDLELIREEIEALRADGVALRVIVEHDFLVVEVSESEAAVIDEIENNSFFVDAETRQPEEGEGSGEVLRYTFLLEKIDDRWVVVRGSREASD